MNNIALVIGWKFNHQPGMSVKGAEIIEFPPDIEDVHYEARRVSLPVGEGQEPQFEVRSIPAQADQERWTAEYEAHLLSIQYQKDRADAYPSIPNQLDMIYWDKKNSTSKWLDAIDEVKEMYPKPS